MIDDSDSVSWQMLFDQIDTVWVESIWLLTDRKKMCSGKESDEQTNRQNSLSENMWSVKDMKNVNLDKI